MKGMNRPSVREVALDALLKVEKNQAYSHLLLHSTLKAAGLDKRDSGLLTELVYGTIARKQTLDYYLAPFIKSGKKRALWIDVLLRLSVYQMVFLDRIPDRAVVHEAVTIANKRGHKGISGLVNGVLRSIQRQGLPNVDAIADPIERAAVQTSHPQWLMARWMNQYGKDDAIAMANANNIPPEVCLRVNRMKTTAAELVAHLGNEGVEAERSKLLPDLAVLIKKGNPFGGEAYKKGLFTAQDEASMLVAKLLGPEEGMDVLDACAAPGGKTTHIAEQMNGTGHILALDLHPHKVKLIAEQAARLGLENIETRAEDARKLQTKQHYDRVLVDAPCTGFGVIRRKPDIRWSKTEKDVKHIANVQAAILAHASQFVKQGGTLVYSTCTIEKEENEHAIERFLDTHPQFETNERFYRRLPDHIQANGRFSQLGLTILPHDFGTDGFFMVALTRKHE